jgi:adenylate kinase
VTTRGPGDGALGVFGERIMILLLLGPPGAGKGTQSRLLSQEYGIPTISTGDMFREHKAKGTEIGLKIRSIMDAGGLVTDAITNAMVEERLARPDVKNGFILDGYPRTLPQAEYLDRLVASMGRRLRAVISYEVTEETLVDRISGRRSCPACGATYHVTQGPPRKTNVCDRDGTALVLRDDDRPENVRKRMQEYASKTEPLKRFYRQRGQLVTVDGLQPVDQVLAQTKKLIASR